MIRKKIITAPFASIVALSGANVLASNEDDWANHVMKGSNLYEIFDLLYLLVNKDADSLVKNYRNKVEAVDSALKKLKKHNDKVLKHCAKGNTERKCKKNIKKIDQIIKKRISEK